VGTAVDRQQAASGSVLNELRTSDAAGYRSFLRMDPLSFDLLLQKVAPLITKVDTGMRPSIPPEERLDCSQSQREFHAG